MEAFLPADVCLILSALPFFGPKTFQKVRAQMGEDLAPLLEFSEKDLVKGLGISSRAAQHLSHWRKYVDLDAIQRKMAHSGIEFLPFGSPHYPANLNRVENPPLGLFQLGKNVPRERLIAMVGSRDCTLYGEQVAETLAAELVRHGYAVVSGLAIGIDRKAHWGALNAGGHTIAVLGGGVDVVYPIENQRLYGQIRKEGTLLSEFLPGREVDRQSFPIRNRVLTGMSDAVVVVETPRSGGSMLSAKFAAEQNKPIFAIPGRITQPHSQGCHDLLRRGARLVSCVEDILEDLQQCNTQAVFDFSAPDSAKPSLGRLHSPAMSRPGGISSPPAELSEMERGIWQWLSQRGESFPEEIASGLQLPILETAQILQKLQIHGRVVRQLSGKFAMK